MSGFIALHRKIEGHWIFEDPDYFRIWVAMLFAANFKEKEALMNGRVVNLERGQLVFGLNAWSARYGVTSRKLRTLLKHLENSGMIDKQTTNKYSIISITNYDEYQSSDKQTTSKRQSDDKQVTTPEEVNKVNKGNKPAAKAAPIGIDRFLSDCKDSGSKAVPEDDPIFAYSTEAGIPMEFMRLCWLEFVERNRESGKRYKDWRAAFRKCVRGNWYKLWWLDGEQYMLSTNGKQAEIKHKASGRL